MWTDVKAVENPISGACYHVLARGTRRIVIVARGDDRNAFVAMLHLSGAWLEIMNHEWTPIHTNHG